LVLTKHQKTIKVGKFAVDKAILQKAYLESEPYALYGKNRKFDKIGV
jgi:hypothetical protein